MLSLSRKCVGVMELYIHMNMAQRSKEVDKGQYRNVQVSKSDSRLPLLSISLTLEKFRPFREIKCESYIFYKENALYILIMPLYNSWIIHQLRPVEGLVKMYYQHQN